MDKITPSLVATVADSMKGKRRETFLASIQVLNAAIENGAWLPKAGHAQAMKGINRLTTSRESLRSIDPHRDGGRDRPPGTNHDLYMLIAFGTPLNAEHIAAHNEMYPHSASTPWTADGKILPVAGLTAGLVESWNELCTQVARACKALDAARPKPVVTAVGLSPKVTATLQECNLDLDLPTIKPAKISFYEKHARDDAGELKFLNGKPVMERVYYVDWTAGIKHNRSRFASGSGCHACGKSIPSGRFVPVEAQCKNLGLVALWLGCDCARNIFGVKDAGIDRTAKPPQ
jgi:hypothetical protein